MGTDYARPTLGAISVVYAAGSDVYEGPAQIRFGTSLAEHMGGSHGFHTGSRDVVINILSRQAPTAGLAVRP